MAPGYFGLPQSQTGTLQAVSDGHAAGSDSSDGHAAGSDSSDGHAAGSDSSDGHAAGSDSGGGLPSPTDDDILAGEQLQNSLQRQTVCTHS